MLQCKASQMLQDQGMKSLKYWSALCFSRWVMMDGFHGHSGRQGPAFQILRHKSTSSQYRKKRSSKRAMASKMSRRTSMAAPIHGIHWPGSIVIPKE